MHSAQTKDVIEKQHSVFYVEIEEKISHVLITVYVCQVTLPA